MLSWTSKLKLLVIETVMSEEALIVKYSLMI